MDYTICAACALIGWNIIVFIMYGADKRKAKKAKRRTSEKALLIAAFLLGGVGAAFGMRVFRHKTNHWKFRILVPLSALITVAAAVVGYYIVA